MSFNDSETNEYRKPGALDDKRVYNELSNNKIEFKVTILLF